MTRITHRLRVDQMSDALLIEEYLVALRLGDQTSSALFAREVVRRGLEAQATARVRELSAEERHRLGGEW